MEQHIPWDNGEVPAPDVDLGWSLGVLFRAWHRGVTQAVADVPHGARGHQILRTLVRGVEPSQAELAAHLGIDRTVLTYVLDDLVGAGLVERRPDAADRRVRRLALTAAGRDRLAELDAAVERAERDLFAGLPAEDEADLRAVLARAARAVHGAEAGHDACAIVADILADDAGAGGTAARRVSASRRSAGRSR